MRSQSIPAGTDPRARRHPPQGLAVILGVLLLLVLIAIAVALHPQSIRGDGKGLLSIDVLLLLIYGAAGLWGRYQTHPYLKTAFRAGAWVGALLGAVQIANHSIELLVTVRPFVVVIVPVLLMLVLLGTVGSAVWKLTGRLWPAVVGGVWCAIVATLISLTISFCLSLAFRARAEWPLREAYSISGMNDPEAFLVKNSLEAMSEVLIRTPILALFLSFTGAVANSWISVSAPRRRLAAVLVPLMLVAGAAALWHANSLVRAARPPFVMSGVVLASVALCSAHAIWGAFRPHNHSTPG